MSSEGEDGARRAHPEHREQVHAPHLHPRGHAGSVIIIIISSSSSSSSMCTYVYAYRER